MVHSRFEEFEHAAALPSPSGIGLAVVRLAQRQDAAQATLTRALQADPALAGRVIGLANAAAGLAEPAASVRQAVERLGPQAVREAALGFSLVSGNSTGRCAAFDYDLYWSFTLACAAAARVLAQERQAIDPDEAQTCGLLARVGLLALACAHPLRYAGVLERCRGSGPETLAAEESAEFRIDHCEVSAALLTKWGLPSSFPAAVLAAGAPGETEAPEDPHAGALAELLQAASDMAAALLRELPQAGAPGAALELFWRPRATVASDEASRGAFERARALWCEWGREFAIPCAADPSARTAEAVPAGLAAPQVAGQGPPPPGAVEQIRVLVVDDDPAVLRLLTHHLRGEGYDVCTADDGQAGLRAVFEQEPQIVVTDWRMPRLSGIDLCRALRQTAAGRGMYLILLTAGDDEQQVVDAFDAGASDFVAKPFNPRTLLARVGAGRRLIGMQREVEARQQLASQQLRELALRTRQLDMAAKTDVLTGLPNRRHALDLLQREWDLASRLGRPLSVVLVDIDHFKSVNDLHGHAVGDEVLRATARVLRSHARRCDPVCRLGGEEFLVINVNSGPEEAAVCAERLRAAVARNRVGCGSFEGAVTISAGCALRDPRHDGVDALLRAADEAVYAAKAAGRNTVRAAPGPVAEAG